MPYLYIILPVFLLLLALLRETYQKRNSRLPPGPPGLPFLGNVLQMPQQGLQHVFDKWAKEYGPIFTVWVLGRPMVILGDVVTIADVLDRNSGITGDRPPFIKGADFYFRRKFLALDNLDLRWRAKRRAIHANLNVHAAARFNPMQENEAATLAFGLLHHPEISFVQHTRRFSASVIFQCLYGGEAIPLTGIDRSKRMSEFTEQIGRTLQPQKSVVDMFPFLKPVIWTVKWLRKEADEWHDEVEAEATQLWESAAPSDNWDAMTFAHDLDIHMDKYGLPKTQAVWNTFALFLTGQETTDVTLQVCVLAMLHHPQVVQTAQNQLDSVCGDRPPTFDDRDSLPYIVAIVKEMLRWRVISPLGVPHKASEDFEYRGYVIPKDTVIISNIWAETHDPAVYPNPDMFDPSRFLMSSGVLAPTKPNTREDQHPFGHGRRICPGRDFANNSLFIACAWMLWAFNFEWPRDEEGRDIVCGVDEFVDKGNVTGPREFGVILKPRKAKLEETLGSILRL